MDRLLQESGQLSPVGSSPDLLFLLPLSGLEEDLCLHEVQPLPPYTCVWEYGPLELKIGQKCQDIKGRLTAAIVGLGSRA
jgi:hypothetical protein